MKSQAFTLIEILVALAIFSVMSVGVSMLLLGSLRTNRDTEGRTNLGRAAETWAERYRAGIEPRTATASCRVSGATLSCLYPDGYAYPASEWAKWDDTFRATVRPFKAELTLRNEGGANVQVNTLEIVLTDPATGKSARFTTAAVY